MFQAFVTTFLLVGTLVFFWLPYMAINFISAHLDTADAEQISDTVMDVKFFVMDLMPIMNYLLDPVIYGIRMNEIRFAYKRLFAKILPCCVKMPHRTSVLSSVRFTTIQESTRLRKI